MTAREASAVSADMVARGFRLVVVWREATGALSVRGRFEGSGSRPWVFKTLAAYEHWVSRREGRGRMREDRGRMTVRPA